MQSLIGSGSIRERLENALADNFLTSPEAVWAGQIPDEHRRKWHELLKRIEAEEPGENGTVRAALAKMNDRELYEVAELVFNIYTELARQTAD